MAADAGLYLRLAVTADAPEASPITTYSNTTRAIETSMWSTLELSGAVAVDEPVTASVDVLPLAGLTVETTYRWETVQTSGSGPDVRRSVQEGGATYTPAPGDEGRTLRVTTTTIARNQAGTVASRSTLWWDLEVAAPVVNTVSPSIDGDTAAGQTLTAEPGTWTGGGSSIDFDYQWNRCSASGDDCAAIEDATGPSYETTAADIGHAITATVGAHSDHSDWTAAAPGGGPRHPVTAGPVGPIVGGEAPAATAAPSLSGVAAERDTLTADPGTWSGDEPIHFTYQWQTCDEEGALCRDVDGATSDSYTMVAADVQARLRVRVTATNGSGSATADSPLSDAVAVPGGPPVVQRVPRLTVMGAPAVGTTVRADEGEWSDADEALVDVAWQRCDADGDGCEDIDDAFGSAYVLTDDDVDHRVKAVVTARTNGGDATAISDPTPEIGAATDETEVHDDQLAFIAGERSELRVGAGDGSESRVVVDCDDITGLTGKCELSAPRIAPDLRAIAFEVRDGTETDEAGTLFVVGVDGSGLRRLVHGSAPAWGPTGATIVYDSGTGWAMEVDSDGVDPTPRRAVLAEDGGGSGFRAFSEDEDEDEEEDTPDIDAVESADVSGSGEIVFIGHTPELGDEIYVAESEEDKAPKRVELGGEFTYLADPRFVPDGDAIVFSAQRDGEFEDGVGLWEVGVDGRDLHRLSPDDGKFYGPGVPTDDEVLTTRSNFDICISPNFARRGAAARSSAPNGYCEIQDTRGYGMNHDGSNPHFLELDADDKDAPKAHAARNLTAEQIRQKEGLDQLERLVRKATESRAKSEVRKAVVEAVAKDLLWAVRRGSIIGTITGFLMDDGNPGCDGKVGFMQRAKTANIKAGNALYQAMGASVAPHPAMTANLQQAIEATKDIIRQAKPALKGPKKCKQFYAPALQAAEKALPSLERGVVYLHEIDFQSQRRKAYAVARYAVDRYPKVGIQTCEDAKVIQDAIGRGSGKRNYFVYWAPPDVVKYVGISRAFDVRCAKHPAARRPLIHTLNLPPLMFQEARSVEEALIAHFGTKDERANNRFRSPGQLENIVHSISPDRDSYCPRLVLGQMLLLENGYGSYAAAYYTREKVCAGVGGPR